MKRSSSPLEGVIALLQRGNDDVKLHNKPLLDGSKLVFSIPQALLQRECAAIITLAETMGFVQVAHAATKEIAFRDNGRLQIYNNALASALWQRIHNLVPAKIGKLRAVGLNPNFRFYKYAIGQRFGPHVDESVMDEDTKQISLFTVLFYLNSEGLMGGETVFYGGGRHNRVLLSVSPEMGMALCHGHGDNCLVHEGSKVTKGTKYLMRTDVMYAC